MQRADDRITGIRCADLDQAHTDMLLYLLTGIKPHYTLQSLIQAKHKDRIWQDFYDVVGKSYALRKRSGHLPVSLEDMIERDFNFETVEEVAKQHGFHMAWYERTVRKQASPAKAPGGAGVEAVAAAAGAGGAAAAASGAACFEGVQMRRSRIAWGLLRGLGPPASEPVGVVMMMMLTIMMIVGWILAGFSARHVRYECAALQENLQMLYR